MSFAGKINLGHVMFVIPSRYIHRNMSRKLNIEVQSSWSGHAGSETLGVSNIGCVAL